MKKLSILVAAAVLVTACHSKSDQLRRDQQQYGVVQEGSASGVTSTINGPGEMTPAMTGTNADNTSNFALGTPPNGTTTAQPGTLARTLPLDPSGSMNSGYPADMPRASASVARPRTEPPPAAPRVVVSQPAPAPRPAEPHASTPPMTSASPQPTLPPSDTASTPPPATDTTTTTNANPPSDDSKPKEKEKARGDKPKDDSAPPPSDTAPPPPPTTTT